MGRLSRDALLATTGFIAGPELRREKLEPRVIAEVEPASLREELQHVGRRPHRSQVYVLRCTNALEAQLEREPALERHRIAGDPAEPREEAVERQELSSRVRASAPLTAKASFVGGRDQAPVARLTDRLVEKSRCEVRLDTVFEASERDRDGYGAEARAIPLADIGEVEHKARGDPEAPPARCIGDR